MPKNGREKKWLRGIYKNAMSLSIADAASKGSTAIIALLIARYLGPTLYGKYAIALSTCGLFMMITGIGFEQEFTRRGGTNQETIPSNLLLNFIAIGITSIIAYAGIIGFFSLDIYSKDIFSIGVFLGITLIVTRFHLPFRHLCLLLNKSNVTATIQSISTVTIVLITLSIIFLKGSLIMIILSQLIVGIIILFIWLWWIPKEYFIVKTYEKKILQFFRDSIPFAISNIIWIAYFNFDTFMLSLYKQESEVGIYAGVYRIIGINYIFGYAITNTFTPLLFEKYSRMKAEANAVAKQLIKTLCFMGVVLSFGLYYYSGFLVLAIIGKKFITGIIVAKILSVAVFFRLLNFGLCEILTTSDHQTNRICLEVILLAVNIILNFFFIPYYGGTGAAMATVIAEAILLIGCMVMIRSKKIFVK